MNKVLLREFDSAFYRTLDLNTGKHERVESRSVREGDPWSPVGACAVIDDRIYAHMGGDGGLYFFSQETGLVPIEATRTRWKTIRTPRNRRFFTLIIDGEELIKLSYQDYLPAGIDFEDFFEEPEEDRDFFLNTEIILNDTIRRETLERALQLLRATHPFPYQLPGDDTERG